MIKKTLNKATSNKPSTLAYKTYDGWDVFADGAPLDLSNVQRFTEGEMKANTLDEGEEWQYFGCYKELDT